MSIARLMSSAGLTVVIRRYHKLLRPELLAIAVHCSLRYFPNFLHIPPFLV
jgi:hypothetical protein